jgi:hypothetical protein
MIYGRGILMIDAARWLSRRRLLAVWREPTVMQLLSIADYVRAVEAAIFKPTVRGIYHVGDEEPVTLQHFWTRHAAPGAALGPCVCPYRSSTRWRRSARLSRLSQGRVHP